jgi:hypothetical protein
MAPVEIPDEGFVILLQCSGGFLLRHNGTGEHKLLVGQWSSAIDGGNVVLQERVGETQWASDHFDNALMLDDRPGFAEPQQFIFSVDTQKKTWHSDCFAHENRARCITLSGAENLQIEVFVSLLPRKDACVRWCLQRLLVHLFGNSFDGRWVTHQIPGLRKHFARFSFPDMINDSPRSVVSKSMKLGMKVDALGGNNCDSQWTCSTEGLLLVAMWAITQPRTRHDKTVDPTSQAASLIKMVVKKFVNPERQALHVAFDTELVQLWLENGLLSCDCVTGVGAIVYVRRLLGRCGLMVEDCLILLIQALARPSKCKHLFAARCLFKALVSFVGATVESQRDSDIFKETDHLDLPTLHRTGSKRPRVVSSSFKQAVSTEVAAWPSLRNAQQFLASRQIILYGARRKQGRVVKGSGPVKASAGRTFCRDNMLRYREAGLRLLGGSRFGHIGFDGTRVSTKELNLYMYECLETRKAAWFVPKVLDC